jgi:hypothetical protein
VAGFALVAVLVVAALWMAMRAAVAHSRPGGRALGLACTGALAAILLHSLVDFNLYVPANAMLLTWIAALAAGLAFSWRSVPAWKPQGAPRVLEARVVSSES